MPDASPPESLFVRLYFDRHIKKQLAIDLRERGFDVLLTEEAGMDTASDEEQLAFAARENRTILTFNIRDFAPLHENWPSGGRTHAGIIVSQQLGSRQYGLLWPECCGCSINSPRIRCAITWFIWNNSSDNPTIATMNRYAKALGRKAHVSLVEAGRESRFWRTGPLSIQ